MPLKGTRHKQKQTKRGVGDIKDKGLRRKFDEMNVAGPTDEAQPQTDTREPATNVEISQFPLYETWETIEEEEREAIITTHKIRTGPIAFVPEYLPVQVHVAAPTAGRFTREIESDIVACNTLEAVRDIVKNSLIFELKRTNINAARTKFAGVMIYGPTNEFTKATIHQYTRGLFLDPVAFKKWWLTVNMAKRADGDMVKIGVVLCDVDEAFAKKKDLPDFWTEPNARILGNFLDGLDLPDWDLDIEQGCRSYVKMQQQVQEARLEAAYAGGDWKVDKKRLEAEVARLKTMEGCYDALVTAIMEGDMDKAVSMATAGKKSIKGKEKAVVDDDEDDAGEDEDEEMEGPVSDSSDTDYVE
ncbi:hypothetical protein EDD36DRAFT_439267 [Exophiala viscosa]|uniref:Uncharacterized protein n=1 Tax=Exophiala viscosa TaxID=2486360 RepID=A0AAN6DXN8_9EURO|nr:hypothetical protein EDD36DRAFT_439267 [Exophiala viscosa]